MSALACTLVSLCVSLTLVQGLPVARRLPDDVLAGSDFLTLFMRRRTADRPGPFEHHYDRELNSVSQKSALLGLIKPFPSKYTLGNVLKYGYPVSEKVNYQASASDVLLTHENEIKTTTQYPEPTTTTEDVPTTDPTTYDNLQTGNQYTTVLNIETSTLLEPTTQLVVTEKIEEKIISVRVSSSVARHSQRTIEASTKKNVAEVGSEVKSVDENLESRLVIQEQPTIHAVQRSEFAVEEAPLVHSEPNDQQESKEQNTHEEQAKVQEVTRFSIEQQRRSERKNMGFETPYHNPPSALLSNLDNKPEVKGRDDSLQMSRRKEFRQLSPYGRKQRITYHSRVSSPTSDSSINFYREYPRNQAAAETVQQPVLAEPYPPAAYQGDEDKQDTEQSQETSTYHERSYGEPEKVYGQQEKVYGETEKVYGQPEQNYEVDEAVSVITNGKTHGVQEPTPPASDQAAQNKFGYVVEGRNFRKYRVEERTNDGFIVGEYGVVSHDDGSLRGVRYTADSNINPRLIYDTLVKFLSL